MRLRLLLLLASSCVAAAAPATASAAPALRGIAEVTGGSRWVQWVESNPNSYHLSGCSPVAPTVRLAFTRPPGPGFRIHWAALAFNQRLLRFAPVIPTGSVPASVLTGDTLPLWLLLSHTASPGDAPDSQYPLLLGTGGSAVTLIVGVWGSDDPQGRARAFLRPRTFTATGVAQPEGSCGAAGLPGYLLL